jgi:hypothetical protein
MIAMTETKIKIAIKKKPVVIKKIVPITPVTPVTLVVEEIWKPRPVKDGQPVIISFDVGIINLAYCIMRISDEAEPGRGRPDIYSWGIIRLADGDPKKVCSRKLKNGNNCGKKAYYIDRTADKGGRPGGLGVCKTHGLGLEQGLGLGLGQGLGLGLGLERNVTVENVSEWELKSMLFKILDSDKKYLDVNSILIESQPLKAREKIKGIGHALFDYYVLRGSIDGHRQYNELTFIDAKNKLTVYTGPPISCHLKTQYARNKWYSIKYCQWILRNQPGLLSFFDGYGKKKDDLADCFLQGLWYLSQPVQASASSSIPVSAHQKLVHRENNCLRYKKIRARAPDSKSIISGKYTLSNIKWLMSKGRDMNDQKIKSSIEFFFGDLDYFCGVLKNT